jgi:hypothetical protein
LPGSLASSQGLRRLMTGPIAMIKMRRLLSTGMRSLLDSGGGIDFFDKLCSAYGYCTSEETPAVLAATMFIDNHVGGVY